MLQSSTKYVKSFSKGSKSKFFVSSALGVANRHLRDEHCLKITRAMTASVLLNVYVLQSYFSSLSSHKSTFCMSYE